MIRKFSKPVMIFMTLFCLGVPLTSFAENVQFSNTPTKIFGQADCNAKVTFSFAWSFVPETSHDIIRGDSSKPAKYHIYLGATTGGILLESKDLPTATTQTDPTTQVSQTTIGSTYSNITSIKDVIQFNRSQGGTQVPDNEVCNLLAASNDPASSQVITVSIEYHYKDTADNNEVKPNTFEGTLALKFDLSPPLAPEELKATPSEKEITLAWKATDGYTYKVYSSTTSFTSDKAKENATLVSSCSSLATASCKVSNLENGVKYYFAVQAVDASLNAGPFSEVVSAEPIELEDFFESYRQNGGSDRGFSGGGYCFLATAAYGSYDHKEVQILRDFRDQFLLTNRPGRLFVAWYYKNSPQWAAKIRTSETLRKVTKAGLAPLIAFASFFVRVPWKHTLPLLGLFFFIFVLLRKKQTVLGMVLLFSLGFTSQQGTAYAKEKSESVFSKPDHVTPRNFGFEIRMGPYYPNIDGESSLNNKPFSTYFGDTSKFYLELGFEWLFFKKVGSLGLAASAGITWATGQSMLRSQPLVLQNTATTTDDVAANNETSLYILPFRLDLTYRFDYFTQKRGFPLVPYVRGGLDYYLWFVLGPPSNSLASTKNSDGTSDSAIGGRFGFHFGVGIQILLDWIDPRSARNFDVEVGVNHTYLFVEWDFSWVGVVTDGLDLSSNGIRAGLMFQF